MKTYKYVVRFNYIKDELNCFFCPHYETGCSETFKETEYTKNDTPRIKQLIIQRQKPHPEHHCKMSERGEGYRIMELEAPYENEEEVVRYIKSYTGFTVVNIQSTEEIL